MSSELIAAAAQVLGIPEALTERSAQARAQADGLAVEDVLRAWAGGETAPAAPPPAVDQPAPAEAAPAVSPAAVETEPPPAGPEPATEETGAPTPAPAAPVLVPSRPVPDSVEVSEAADWAAVTTVATAGLKERTRTQIPVWLTSLFVVLPLVGILYLLLGAGGPACGDGGLLGVDRMTGELVNCDGSRFEGRGTPGGTVDFFARGQALYADAQVACNGCHGNNGEGGVGPAFTGGEILATFPSCADHVLWVQLGSAGWQAQVGAEYGARNTLSVGGMPNFGDALSDADLRSVVVFERIRFGAAGLDETLIDCGLVEPAEGETPAGEGETPAGESEEPGGEGQEPGEEGEPPAEGDTTATTMTS